MYFIDPEHLQIDVKGLLDSASIKQILQVGASVSPSQSTSAFGSSIELSFHFSNLSVTFR